MDGVQLYNENDPFSEQLQTKRFIVHKLKGYAWRGILKENGKKKKRKKIYMFFTFKLRELYNFFKTENKMIEMFYANLSFHFLFQNILKYFLFKKKMKNLSFFPFPYLTPFLPNNKHKYVVAKNEAEYKWSSIHTDQESEWPN